MTYTLFLYFRKISPFVILGTIIQILYASLWSLLAFLTSVVIQGDFKRKSHVERFISEVRKLIITISKVVNQSILEEETDRYCKCKITHNWIFILKRRNIILSSDGQWMNSKSYEKHEWDRKDPVYCWERKVN